jgi:isoaspartyl peptidase/L-asparaginase-like protein (Ntn-hydrolase superfamily)
MSAAIMDGETQRMGVINIEEVKIQCKLHKY